MTVFMRAISSVGHFLPAVTAGFVAVLVGYAGAAIIVIQAIEAGGASQALVASWMTVLGISMAASTIGLSLFYRQPVLTAWSTPGAALLVVGLQGHTMGEAVAAIMLTGLLTLICGVTGVFARLMSYVPQALAAAMLAGILLQFGLHAFGALADGGWACLAALSVWLLARRMAPRYAVVLMVAVGAAVAATRGTFSVPDLHGVGASLHLIRPQFSWTALVGIGLPLFVVTMASQNAPGVAMLEKSGYRPAVSPILICTGLLTLVLAPIGGFVICLAAITAGICLSPDAHPEPDKRYYVTCAAGGAYFLAGIFGSSIVALLHTLPPALITLIAGLALLPTIAACLGSAMSDADTREAATLTFVLTGSGLHVFGIGSPFWGLVGGIAALLWWRVGSDRSLQRPTRGRAGHSEATSLTSAAQTPDGVNPPR